VSKFSSASITMVVLDNFSKLNSFFVNFFASFHYILVLLLYRYFSGICTFAIHQRGRNEKCFQNGVAEQKSSRGPGLNS